MMIIYFLMISFASLVITAEFLFDIHGKDLPAELVHNFERLSGGEIQAEAAFQPLQALRNKAVLMVGLFLVVVLILLTMFIKNITEPLQHMIETSKLIAAGDLSQTVSVHAKNELAEMGNTVNELTSNLQEMILLSKDLCAAVNGFTREYSDALAAPEAIPSRQEEIQKKIQVLNSKSDFMNRIILNCKFYGMGK